jgi:hypothetical protein
MYLAGSAARSHITMLKKGQKTRINRVDDVAVLLAAVDSAHE